MKDEKAKKLNSFVKAVIVECIVLALCVIAARIWIFPHLAHGGMKHVIIATHCFMIGLSATVFAIFAVLFRRKWKTHKKFILPPAIFAIFGYLLLIAANDINF